MVRGFFVANIERPESQKRCGKAYREQQRNLMLLAANFAAGFGGQIFVQINIHRFCVEVDVTIGKSKVSAAGMQAAESKYVRPVAGVWRLR